jgi:hypothetical protein
VYPCLERTAISRLVWLPQPKRAPSGETARSRSAGGGEPLRAREIDGIGAEAVALNLTLESVLALDKQVQILALEVPNTLKEVALDERLLDDACATLFAGCWSRYWRRW